MKWNFIETILMLIWWVRRHHIRSLRSITLEVEDIADESLLLGALAGVPLLMTGAGIVYVNGVQIKTTTYRTPVVKPDIVFIKGDYS